MKFTFARFCISPNEPGIIAAKLRLFEYPMGSFTSFSYLMTTICGVNGSSSIQCFLTELYHLPIGKIRQDEPIAINVHPQHFLVCHASVKTFHLAVTDEMYPARFSFNIYLDLVALCSAEDSPTCLGESRKGRHRKNGYPRN